jgi:hypothetical protein
MFSTGQLMGGTFDEVPARNAELSTLLAAGKVRRGANGTCTLLGPEGPGVAFEPNLTSGPFLAAVTASGEGTARTLRTTQWTRAS